MRLQKIDTFRADDSYLLLGERINFDIDVTATTQNIAAEMELIVRERGGNEITRFTEDDGLIVARSDDGLSANVSAIYETHDLEDVKSYLIWELYTLVQGRNIFLWGRVILDDTS